MSYCTNLCLVNGNPDLPEATVLKCHAWTCPRCESGRREALRRLALAGNPTKFLTLTVNPAVGIDADDRARALIWAWRILIKRIARMQKTKKIDYLWVIEATKNGEPHLHVLMRADYIDQRYISSVMTELINAPIVHVKAVNNGAHAAAYVAKYCSKDARKFAGCKRYGYSSTWIIDEEYINEIENFTGAAWKKATYDLNTYATRLTRAKYDIEWCDDETLIGHKEAGFTYDVIEVMRIATPDHAKAAWIYKQSFGAAALYHEDSERISVWDRTSWLSKAEQRRLKEPSIKPREKYIPPANFTRLESKKSATHKAIKSQSSE